jgi:glc operon protein GlcG
MAGLQRFSTTNAWHQRCDEAGTTPPQASPSGGRQNRRVKLDRAQAIVDFVVKEAPGAVSVFVADDHGEIVAAATMDGAAPDTRLNAQRKAYTAARADARATSELAAKVAEDPVERASFDPFFTFFKGGVAAFEGETRVGAIGVSGLPGEVDEDLARRAIRAAGLSD